MNKVSLHILEKLKEKIINKEYNKLWNKVNPFFIKFLTVKKNNNIMRSVKSIILKDKYSNCLQAFQYRLLIKKITERKNSIKYIYNFSSTKLLSKYWMNLIHNILIIQKHIKIITDKNKILKNINNIYFNEDTNLLINDNKEINEELFPSTKLNKIISELKAKNKEKLMNKTKILTPRNNNILTSVDKRHIKEIKNKIIKENLPTYYNYPQPKITIFAKILDIDIINDSSDIENKSWAEEFLSIYRQNISNNTPIQKIYIGNCHSIALNSEGKIYTWGWNNFGQCGAYPDSTKQKFIIPMFKSEKNRTQKLPLINYKTSEDALPIQNVNDILINDDYSIILTEKGNAIAFGKNNNGELGLSHKKVVKNAQLMSKFKNKIKIIKTTGDMNLLLTKNNELFIWSSTRKLKLQKPTMVYLHKRINIISISTGKNFAILLSNKGICYGCGSNEKGELGILNAKYCISPEEITELKKYNEGIVQVNCGYKHTICLSEKGKCYSWGNNSYGQLGHETDNLPLPVIIEENKEIIRIIQVSAGFRASFFLGYNGNIYYCGKMNNKNNSKIVEKYNIIENNEEISNKKEFYIVKIWNSFSLYKSILYASVADVRNIYTKFQNQLKIKEILNILAENWINDNKNPPFIPVIAKYFKPEFMKLDV